jgi:hypothetical protein
MRIVRVLKRTRIVKALYRFAVRVFAYSHFVKDYRVFARQRDNRGFHMTWRDRKPCLGEKTAGTRFDHHYVYHTAWAARKIAQRKPSFHVDISSDIRFVTMLSAFVPVRYYDYRPADLQLSSLTSSRADLTRLEFHDNEIASLSCMHVVEHIGLGRYGDSIRSDADIQAVEELKRVVSSGGDLYFVVPVGQPRIIFNAHRIYSYEMVCELFRDLVLEEFALITDDNAKEHIIMNPSPDVAASQTYGCGCFWFRKP